MHVLYVHQNFPAQFGHIAAHLAQRQGWRCTFVSQTPPGTVAGIEKIQYAVTGGATQQTHFCSRTFENAVWHAHGVFEALRARDDIRPDLIVGHSGFGSTVFLNELYPGVPVINLFEYYYRPHGVDSDMDFRKDLNWEVPQLKYLRSTARNAMILLDLENCRAGYTPTRFQKARFPEQYDAKLRVIFDGIDRRLYHGHKEALRPPPEQRGPRVIAGQEVPADVRVVTYVSRGFESMRGFDIFMQAADLIARAYPNVIFLIAGTDRMPYGGDENYLPQGQTFKDWVLARHEFDLSKFRFLGHIPPQDLALMLAASDLHIYLTVPFVLSWSMMNAMSCGAVVLGSATSPVQEMITDGTNGLLADFFHPQDFADKAVAVLKDPGAYRQLGRAAEQMVAQRYSLEAVLPTMMRMYEQALRPPQADQAPPVAPADVVTGVARPSRSPFRG